MNQGLPILTSHCPGWVCYAEKTSPQAIPYLSTVKSAQQIVGVSIKNILLSTKPFASSSSQEIMETDLESELTQALADLSFDLTASTASQPPKSKASVFVVSVQPCFDKKLEASRKDFYHSESNTMDVDMVLSTSELWQLLETTAWSWMSGISTGESMSYDSANDSTDNLSNDDQNMATESSKSNLSHSRSKKVKLNSFDRPISNRFEEDMEIIDLDAPTTEFLNRRETTQRNFVHVYQYLDNLDSDSPFGSDDIEKLFRCPSPSGIKLVSAGDSYMSSGGYADYLFKYIAYKEYNLNLWGKKLVYKEGRNADLSDIDMFTILKENDPSIEPQLESMRNIRFARAYGFRNIQSILLKLKRGLLDYDLIEIMACPSGCNNGGGQLKTLSSILPITNYATTNTPSRTETPQESKDRIQSVEKVFHQSIEFADPANSLLVQYLYDSRRLVQPLSEASKRTLHTRYHAVPKLETIAPLAAKW